MESIVLIGNGGHCKSCMDIVETSQKYIIKGIVSHPDDDTKYFMNYKVIGNDNNISECFEKDDLALICIGQINSAEKRIRLFNLLDQKRISIATVKSKFSIISENSFIGIGTVVMHGVIVNSGSFVGVNCILNTNSLVEHDVKIGNHCHISTGVIINGGVEIGNECFVGSGCILREGVKIGNKSIISAGQIVMKDVPENCVIK